MDYLVYALLAVVLFFGSFITWFVWHGGLEPGPLATWLSGAASTCAVVVALWAQQRALSNRREDKSEKDIADGYQALIKMRAVLAHATSSRRYFRTGILVGSASGKDYGTYKYLYLKDATALSGMFSDQPQALSEAQENLFARRSRLEELIKLRVAFGLHARAFATVRRHEQLTKKMEERIAHVRYKDTGGISKFLDFKDAATRNTIAIRSNNLILAMNRFDRALKAIGESVPAAARTLRAYGVDTDGLDAAIVSMTSELEHALPGFPDLRGEGKATGEEGVGTGIDGPRAERGAGKVAGEQRDGAS